MKFPTLAAVLLAPSTLAVATATDLQQGEPSCIDLTTCADASTSPDASIAASKRKGKLTIKLSHATNLKNKDLFGNNDPFIEMWLEKSYKQRSKDTKGNNPVFDETFCFYVRPGQDTLYVKAIDYDPLVNDKIGDASISLSEVFVSGNVGARDYKLPEWLGLSDSGSVNLQLQYQEDYS
ncbi:Extended synaptotagmin-1 [Mortierella sp. AD094]|nr:Extended synaptotagmin-1 [Mortierella sp. AD094]